MEKTGSVPGPIEFFRLMHVKKDGVTFASKETKDLCVCFYNVIDTLIILNVMFV